MDIDISVDNAELRRMVETLDSIKNKALQRALSRSGRKLSRWVSTQVARASAKQYGFKVGDFKRNRIIVSWRGTTNRSTYIWIGANPVQAHLVGDPKHERDYGGVFVKDYFFKGAFIWRPGSETDKVFRRVPKKGQTKMSKRLPIAIQSVEINKGVEENTRRLMSRAKKRYQTILSQEINFELSKLR